VYTVQHFSYCGMSGIAERFDDSTDARAEAADRLRRYRRRYRVAMLTRGQEWEILEPENCAMVPDSCGILTLRRQFFQCRECGSRYDTRHDALHCCCDTDE